MVKNGLFLFLFAFFVLVVFIPSYTDMQDLKTRNTELEEQIELLEAKNKELAREKKLLEEDPVYLESVAREKMGIAREGEVVYRLTPEEESDQE